MHTDGPGDGTGYADELRDFVAAHFGEVGSDSLPWEPDDWEASAITETVDRLPVRPLHHPGCSLAAC
jgi:hypothetical protein